MTNPQAPHSEKPKSRHMNHYPQNPPKKKMEIDIDIDLPDAMVLELALMAHHEEITLNELCIRILKEHLSSCVSWEECPHDSGQIEKMGGFICRDCGKLMPREE